MFFFWQVKQTFHLSKSCALVRRCIRKLILDTYLQLNPVKFIKTSPCASLCQPFEEFTHSLEIQTIRAVKYNALKGITIIRNINENKTLEVLL